MITYCKENLQEIKRLLVAINDEHYRHPSQLLSEATIGQHIRHILEFYLCLMNGVKSGTVNYDTRERDLELEINRPFAIYTIDKICSNISIAGTVDELNLEGNFSSTDGETTSIKTSVSRELAYCLEHSIHHQALIKISLIEQQVKHVVDPNFGVAPATIRHKEKCAQ